MLQVMDCFILPSYFEGLPLVGIEAQTAGLPCYFSDTITEELRITVLAHYLPLNSPGLWAKKIIKKRNLIRLNMKKNLINTDYDIHTEVKKVECLYRNK